MDNKHSSFSYQELNGVEECSAAVQELFKMAAKAKDKAYAPYSKFKVGAALLLEDGEIFTGNNQENAAYPSGLCAERVAIFAAKSQKTEAVVKSLVIVTNAQDIAVPVAPCGSCRQVLVEYEFMQKEKFDIYLQGSNGKVIRIPSAESLLPFSFHSEMLNS
ncbi:cytidine deaminase [Flavobacteriaceae bacterium Ap0902]|nr:cytidine deaminase [Flavobacteriaceae bacterium Ap0902]